MGAHASIKISKGRAVEIILNAIRDDETLRELVSKIVSEKTLYNVYALVPHGDPECQDDRVEGL